MFWMFRSLPRNLPAAPCYEVEIEGSADKVQCFCPIRDLNHGSLDYWSSVMPLDQGGILSYCSAQQSIWWLVLSAWKKPHHIATLWFREVVNDHSKYLLHYFPSFSPLSTDLKLDFHTITNLLTRQYFELWTKDDIRQCQEKKKERTALFKNRRFVLNLIP